MGRTRSKGWRTRRHATRPSGTRVRGAPAAGPTVGVAQLVAPTQPVGAEPGPKWLRRFGLIIGGLGAFAIFVAVFMGMFQTRLPNDKVSFPVPGVVTKVLDLRTLEGASNLVGVSALTVTDSGDAFAAAEVNQGGVRLLKLARGLEDSTFVDLANPPARVVTMENVALEPRSDDFADVIDPWMAAPPSGLLLGTGDAIFVAPTNETSGVQGNKVSTDVFYPRSTFSVLDTGELFKPETPRFIDFAYTDEDLYLLGADNSPGLYRAVDDATFPPVPIGVQSVDLDQSGKLKIEDGSTLTVSHLGTLVVVDRAGTRLMVRRAGQISFDVLRDGLKGVDRIVDVAVDEFDNLYLATQSSIERLDRFGSIQPLWSGSTRGADPKGVGVALAGVRRVVLAPSGDLYVIHDAGQVVSRIEKVSGLWRDTARLGSWLTYPATSALSLRVAEYCVCVGVSPPGTVFMKTKLEVENSSKSTVVSLNPNGLFVLAMYAGNPSLSYSRQDGASNDSPRLVEATSNREVAVTTASDVVRPEALETVLYNGSEYSIYALPANPNDALMKSGTDYGFSSSIGTRELLPGERYFDARPGYSSAVFYVPVRSSDETPISPIILGLGMWDGTRWISMDPTYEWGSVATPWSF